VRAAAALWSSEGYHSTTIEQICVEAGIKRPTFYIHFETKDSLLEELAWTTADSLSADLQSHDNANIDEEIDAFIDGLVRRMHAIPKALAALVLDRVSGPPPELPTDRVILDDILAGIIRRAQANGSLTNAYTPTDIGALLGGMTMDTLKRWAHAQGDNLRDLLDMRFRIVLDGIRVQPTDAR
jgi:AcrR family transcriptional regulator